MAPLSSPHQPPVRAKKPWSLTCICWLCILAGAVPAVVLWFFNNRRLGLSPSLQTRLFIGASLAIYAIALVRLILVEQDSAVLPRLQFVGGIMLIIVSWQLYCSQRIALVRYCKTGSRTENLRWPIAGGLIWLLLLASASAGVDSIRTERDYKEFERVASSLQQEGTDLQKAERYFQDFKRKYPEETSAYWNLAIIYSESDRIEEAKTELKELLILDPQSKEARDYLSELEAY